MLDAGKGVGAVGAAGAGSSGSSRLRALENRGLGAAADCGSDSGLAAGFGPDSGFEAAGFDSGLGGVLRA